MPDAWAMTYREFTLLVEVKDKKRPLLKEQQSQFDDERLVGLEEHLRNLGVIA